MRIFENHFENNTTYIVGNWCTNGHNTFHKDKSHEIFEEYNLSKEFQNDILSSFMDDENEDWDNILNDYKDNSEIKALLASNNKFLNILINDKSHMVRAEVAKHGYGLYILINDSDPRVRKEAGKQINKK